MISIPFGEFMAGNYEKAEYPNRFELYVVRNGANEVRYVGISQAGIWNRWFGSRGRVTKNAGGYWNIYTDSVGQEIIENMPYSLCWPIELWSKEDCLQLFEQRIKTIGYIRDRVDIKTCEPWMIEKLEPALNFMYRNY